MSSITDASASVEEESYKITVMAGLQFFLLTRWASHLSSDPIVAVVECVRAASGVVAISQHLAEWLDGLKIFLSL